MPYERWDADTESVVVFDTCDVCGCVCGVSGPCNHGCWPAYHTVDRSSDHVVLTTLAEQRLVDEQS